MDKVYTLDGKEFQGTLSPQSGHDGAILETDEGTYVVPRENLSYIWRSKK